MKTLRLSSGGAAQGLVEALRAALLAADALHFPDPEQATAGNDFAGVLRQLGVGETLAGRRRSAPNGATALRALAASSSRRPLGSTQATKILSTPGIALAGPLPSGCALATTYAGAVPARSAMAADARSLIAQLADQANRDLRRRLGFS